MSSVEEIEFADIQNMEYPLTRNENRNICNSYSYEPYSLTVVFGAVCLDGIVLIADRKLTNTIGGKEDAGIKIHGDLEHILMGYTGAVKMFDIFRKYVVGDVIITRADEERYKYDNVLDTMSTLLKEFNDSIGRQHSMFEMLVAKHRGVNSELYHIDISGETNKINYKAIGIGKLIADTFCKKLFEDKHKQPTMKEFIKRAYTAIMYMEQFCSGMGVGIGDDIPDIKYLYYDQVWDKKPTEDTPQGIEDCKNYANEKLKKVNESLEEVIKTL